MEGTDPVLRDWVNRNKNKEWGGDTSATRVERKGACDKKGYKKMNPTEGIYE